MRKTEFTLSKQKMKSYFLDFVTALFGKRGIFILNSFIFLLLITSYVNTAKAQCVLVCNDDINVSLSGPNEDCEVEISVDMILEDPDACPGEKYVTVMDTWGNEIPNSPFVDETYIGQTLMYSVTHPASGNSCMGEMFIEDKLGPMITDCDDYSIYCLQNPLPPFDGGVVPAPSFYDCSDFSVTYYDQTNQGDCNDDYNSIITRHWIATDAGGYISSCEQTITVQKVSLTDFTPTCPPHITLECDTNGQPNTNPTVTGYPTIEINGTIYDLIPGETEVCQIEVTYTDQLLNLCGAGYKYLRTWTVIDDCFSTVETFNPWTCIQVVKVDDNLAPDITCPDPNSLIVGTVSAGCSASVNLPPATVYDACSSVEVTVSTPFGQIDGNGGILLNVPVGTHDITYTAIDACGNQSSCETSFTVVDDTPPVAICDEFTTVSLTDDGTAIVSASVFDDGSSDNCTLGEFKVSRMGSVCQSATPFDDYVWFDCCDIGNPVTIVFRVFDDAGNFNDCMVEVEVQDKLPPEIICPADKYVECGTNLTDLSIFGSASATDNCSNPDITETASYFLNDCGTGHIVRTFTATDAGGRTDVCSQVVYIENSSPFTEQDIFWPLDFSTDECGAAVNPDDLPANYSQPIVSEDACDLVAVTYSDQYLPVAPPGCFKILRTWMVMDWCSFNEDDPYSEGYWEHIQVIMVLDDEAPVINCPSDIVFDSFEPDCGNTYVEIDDIEATDCNPQLNFDYSIDLYNDGSQNYYGTGNNASRYFPMGTHKVSYQVEDGCGNISYCDFLVTVRDGKKPTPVCVNGLSVDLMQMGDGGMVEIQPLMVDHGSFDNCTEFENLEFYLTPSVFTCADLGTNLVQLWVTDEAGNSDYCETYVVIQDNFNICPEQPNMGGAIANEEGYGIENVTIELSGEGNFSNTTTTDSDGNFIFQGLTQGYDYTVTPFTDSDIHNGVSTYDLVLISKHILGIEPFDSPYKFIAADANNSGSVTTYDMVEIRKVILYANDEFTNNNSWRFIDADYVFPNEDNPFTPPFPEVLNFNNLSSNELTASFVGVKTGDINNSATPNSLLGSEDRDVTGRLTFNTDDKMVTQGEEIEIAFTANDFNNFLGYQFTLSFNNNALEYSGFQKGALESFSEGNIGFSLIDEGIITTSWDNTKNNTQFKNNSILFTLKFTAQANAQLSELITINSRFTNAEAYDKNGELYDVQLQFNNGSITNTIDTGFELYQNEPNPFKGSTVISFSLPESSNINLTIFDVTGKTLKEINGYFEKGYNQIELSEEVFSKRGILYYRLETGKHIATKKMIRL